MIFHVTQQDGGQNLLWALARAFVVFHTRAYEILYQILADYSPFVCAVVSIVTGTKLSAMLHRLMLLVSHRHVGEKLSKKRKHEVVQTHGYKRPIC